VEADKLVRDDLYVTYETQTDNLVEAEEAENLVEAEEADNLVEVEETDNLVEADKLV
jgi:hypothetical protein